MDIQPIFRCAGGMDVHLTTISVCVIVAEPGSEPQPVGWVERSETHRVIEALE